MSFSQLGLSDKVLAAVQAAGYTTPTPIQEQAIPHVLARRDVLGIAQTGTGKTAAFTLPMITRLENGRARARMPRTLILEPTRELAAQVQESFEKYGAGQKLNVALVIGGVSFDEQDAKLTRGVDVLIATPGRLLDHFERGRLLLTGVELLVIDEADRMLDMGFIPDIERICKLVPFTRQTLFFTATMPPEIRRITEQFLHNPVKVEVSRPATTVATTTQMLVKTGREPHDKRDTLRRLIRRLGRPDQCDHLLQSQARSRGAASLAGPPRLFRDRTAWRHGSVRAHGRARPIPQERSDLVGRFRRRRARPRHSGGQPHLQFRRPASSRRLRPSHRPHRPRRTHRHCHYRGRRRRTRKSVAAIEKLIGQSIPWMGGEPRGPAPERSEADGPGSADQRNGDRHGERRNGGPRNDQQRNNGEQRASGGRRHGRGSSPRRDSVPAPVARLDDVRPRRTPKPASQAADADDGGHLPAFLLRPVRVKPEHIRAEFAAAD